MKKYSICNIAGFTVQRYTRGCLCVVCFTLFCVDFGLCFDFAFIVCSLVVVFFVVIIRVIADPYFELKMMACSTVLSLSSRLLRNY